MKVGVPKYECMKCGIIFESDEPIDICECGSMYFIWLNYKEMEENNTDGFGHI